jgi:hypothetical protein
MLSLHFGLTKPGEKEHKNITTMASESSSFTLRIAATAVVIGAASLIAYTARPRKTAEEETWESHCTGHGSLTEIWPDTLWILEAKGCSYGPPTRNMVIYKVPDGSKRLVVYNGIAVDEATITQIENFGTPTVLVVPNFSHRCCAAVWKKRYPSIMVVSPQAARDKACKVVEVNDTTDGWCDMPEWKEWVHAKSIDGWCDFEYIVEVELEKNHAGKKAVIVCDLLFTIPHNDKAGYVMKALEWAFDSSISLPPEGIVIPKVSRISRICAIEDWPKAEQWYRTYAREHGRSIAVIAVGHGMVVKEVDPDKGCTEALEGVADQLTKRRW